jgi:hypothetical protein
VASLRTWSSVQNYSLRSGNADLGGTNQLRQTKPTLIETAHCDVQDKGGTAGRYLFKRPKDRSGNFVSSCTVSGAPSYPAVNPHNRTQVTFGHVLPCRKAHLATYCKHGKALSLRVDDIGRRRPLTRRRPGRQLPVVSAFSASEGWPHRFPGPHPIPVTK